MVFADLGCFIKKYFTNHKLGEGSDGNGGSRGSSPHEKIKHH